MNDIELTFGIIPKPIKATAQSILDEINEEDPDKNEAQDIIGQNEIKDKDLS